MNAPIPPPSAAGTESPTLPADVRWYREVTRYQWLVLFLASAGWVFDIYEGQIFNITRNQMLADVLPDSSDPEVRARQIHFYGDVLLGVFLVGGMLGGILFGALADRYGRRASLIMSILMYSVFSGLTYFAENIWQVAGLRFLVAMGIGGEWAVAASLVAEVFPQKARARAGGIFHATSMLGGWLAALAGMAVGAQWRYAYLLGVLPALLIVWVRASIEEPAGWKKAEESLAARSSRLGALLGDPRWRRRALLGMLLAAVGLGTFWSITIAGQNLAEDRLVRDGVSKESAAEKAKFAFGIVQVLGGGLGQLAFGLLCERFGRRRAFIGAQLTAVLIVPITCYLPANYDQLLVLLPIFGAFTVGIHSGYAIYFPELFPTHVRATGTGFCFNGGRLIAAGMLIFSGWLKALPGMDLHLALSLLGLTFMLGAGIVVFLPETKGQPLPE